MARAEHVSIVYLEHIHYLMCWSEDDFLLQMIQFKYLNIFIFQNKICTFYCTTPASAITLQRLKYEYRRVDLGSDEIYPMTIIKISK